MERRPAAEVLKNRPHPRHAAEGLQTAAGVRGVEGVLVAPEVQDEGVRRIDTRQQLFLRVAEPALNHPNCIWMRAEHRRLDILGRRGHLDAGRDRSFVKEVGREVRDLTEHLLDGRVERVGDFLEAFALRGVQ